MTIDIDDEEGAGIRVDRDGSAVVRHGKFVQGLDVKVCKSATIHFDNENHAVAMAKMILDRMGER